MNSRNKTPLSTWLAAIFFFAILPIFPGCTGGCGEDTSDKSADQGQGAPGQATAPSGGHGTTEAKSAKPGGTVKDGSLGDAGKASRFDSAGKDPSKGANSALGALGEVSTQLSAGQTRTVSEDEFKAKVLRQGATVFLTVTRSDCPDCDMVAPVIKALSPEFAGKFEFMQLDGAAVGASGLLPKGVALEPLPAFIMYKDGKATSFQQGLPFPRAVNAQGAYTEAVEDYQGRLMRWFHDALAQKNLNFARMMRKAAPKKG